MKFLIILKKIFLIYKKKKVMPPKKIKIKACSRISPQHCQSGKRPDCEFNVATKKCHSRVGSPASMVAPKAKRPASKSPSAKAVAKKSPSAKAVAKKSPSAKRPASKSPRAKRPASKSPSAKRPASKSPNARRLSKASMEGWGACPANFKKKKVQPPSGKGRCTNFLNSYAVVKNSPCNDKSKYRFDKENKKCRVYSR
jgi:hypothetical protein